MPDHVDADAGASPPPGRPHMPAGYGISRGLEGTLPWSAARDKLVAARNYWVSTTRPDGRPHAAPVWGLWLDEAFYFSTDAASAKGRNLAANPHAIVHLESGDDVVILEGEAETVSSSALLARFVDAYEAKYRFRPEVTGTGALVYRLRHRVALAWLERDFPRTATRWVFE